MDSYGKWFYRSLAITIVAVGLVGVSNYVVDPYGIFRKDFSYQFIEPDKDFIKTRYIARNPDRFNCFVFGSSRANSIDVRKIKDANCYNMHAAVALPKNYLDDLRYLLSKGAKPKLVLIGLDDFSFRLNPRAQLSHPLQHPYPPVLNQSTFIYYLKYLFSIHGKKILRAVFDGYLQKLNGSTETAFAYRDLFATGQVYSRNADKNIEADPEKHMKNPVFTERAEQSGNNMIGAVEDLRALVELAKAHHVRLIFFINPLYRYAYLGSGLDEFDSFKKQLSGITEFYDFSGLNAITMNPYYFYDNAHYRPKLGDMIIARIFGGENAQVPPDFGVLVTAQNVDRHLATLRQEAAKEINR